MDLIPIVNRGLLYADGCNVAVPSNTTLTVGAGQVRDYTNTFDITVDSALTIDSAIVGVNGLDTGTIAIDTFYAVYVIHDASHANVNAGLISAASSAPSMPSNNGVTYSNYRLVGYVKTDGSGNFLANRITGNGNLRHHHWDLPISVLAAGAATGGFAAVDLSAAVPGGLGNSDSAATSVDVTFEALFTPNIAGEFVELSSGESGATAGSSALSGVVAAVAQIAQLSTVADYMPSTEFEIRYQNSAASGSTDLGVSGFTYFI